MEDRWKWEKGEGAKEKKRTRRGAMWYRTSEEAMGESGREGKMQMMERRK